MTPREQATAEWRRIMDRRADLDQGDRSWTTAASAREWIRTRTAGIVDWDRLVDPRGIFTGKKR